MKRTLLTLALVAAAGVAGAQTVTPPSVGSGTVTTPSVNPGAVTTPAIPGAPAVGGATIMPPGTTSGSATTPSVTSPSVMAPSITAPNTANLPAVNADGSAGVQSRIEADGYSNVQGLNLGADGKWRGQATRGGARVGIVVDAQGTVTTE